MILISYYRHNIMFTGIIIYYNLLKPSSTCAVIPIYNTRFSAHVWVIRVGTYYSAYYLFSFFPRRRHYNRATGDRDISTYNIHIKYYIIYTTYTYLWFISVKNPYIIYMRYIRKNMHNAHTHTHTHTYIIYL